MTSNFAFHSECVKRQVQRDNFNPIDTLRLLNIPYVNPIWQSIIEDVTVDPYDYISRYIKAIGPRRAYVDFQDSEFGTVEEGDKFNITSEMRSRWGLGLSDNEYIELETSYQNLCELKEPTNKLDRDRYIANAWINRRKNEALQSGSPADIKNMMKAYEDDLKNIGLDSAAVQGTESKKTLSQRIAEWEQEAPIPEISDEFNDIDNIEAYFKQFFLFPMLENMGKADTKMRSYMNKVRKSIIPGRGKKDGE